MKSTTHHHPDDVTSKALLGLAECEIETKEIDKQIENERIEKMKEVYKRRDENIKKIDGFWKIVLSQHTEFSNFVRASDFKYIDLIESIKVDWKNIDDFDIIIHFNKSGDDDLVEQTIVKKCRREFRSDGDDEDEVLISEVADIKWPKKYDSINPDLIKDKKTDEGKKNYRSGMKSFFGWFRWTGLKPGKEFPHGQELITLIIEDLYPYCVRYYVEAQRDFADERSESGSSEDEALDL